MAVVDEYYSSRLELGPPAAVAYMAGFMGERERMNRAIIDQMLATSDPKVLAERERDARKALNDLLKLKAQVGVAGGKANTDIIKALLQYRASERGSQAREAAAITAARGAFAKSYMYQEGRKQEAIAAGRDAAAKGSDTATAPSRQTYASDQAQVNSYQTALNAAEKNTTIGSGNLVGFAGRAASLKLAEDALAAAEKEGHTAAAAWIKRTYFDNKDPSTYYQESDFRPKTEEEILKTAAEIPTGGKGGLAQIVGSLEGDLGMDPGEIGKLVYGTVKVDGKTLEQQYGPPTQDALDEAGAAAVVTGVAPVGADTGEIDTAIADVKAQIAQMQSQRGKRPSLQEIAASRYPNYLYTNPFQVRSRKFDQFQEELGRLSPRGRERYMEAMDRAPEVFPSVFARRDLERTEPADIPTEGFRFEDEGVDTSKPGEAVAAKVADLLKKTQEVFAQPVQIGDRGDTVRFVQRDGKPEVEITQTNGKKVYAPQGSKTYDALAQQVSDKAPEVSGLTAYMNTLPDSVGERELAPVYAALTSGGYAAAEAEARKLAETGDVFLDQVYARELEDIAGDPDAVKRNDRLEALRGKVPEGVSWAPALNRVLDATTIETATTGAGELSRALRDAFPEGLAAGRPGEVATRFETRAAQERAKAVKEPTKEERAAGLAKLSENARAAYEAERVAARTERAQTVNPQAERDVRTETAVRPGFIGSELTQAPPLRLGSLPDALARAGQLATQQRKDATTQAAIAQADARYKETGNPFGGEGFLAGGVRQALPPKQEDTQADLVSSMLSGAATLPAPKTVETSQAERKAAATAAAVKQTEKEMAAYEAKQQPGRSGPLPAPRAAAPVTKADLDAVDAAVMGMPVPAPPARTPAKAPPAKATGTGTVGADREKKTPPPAAKKAKQKAEDDADEL
jgi:hypothetical protein